MALIEARSVSRTFRAGNGVVEAVSDVDLTVEAGRQLILCGVSGSGKSTLLALLGGLDRPTRGEVLYAGQPLWQLTAGQLGELRRRHFGFLFQDFRLIPHLTAYDNVRLPSALNGCDRSVRARELLERFDLGRRLGHRPEDLSRGEMQRVALARALLHEPDVLLADEPTASLDPANAEAIRQLLDELSQNQGLTVVLATHDPRFASDRHRIVRLTAGRIE